jgi:hypothetical protein
MQPADLKAWLEQQCVGRGLPGYTTCITNVSFYPYANSNNGDSYCTVDNGKPADGFVSFVEFDCGDIR